MKSLLIRTASVPIQSPHVSGSPPRLCLWRSDSLSGVFSGENSSFFPPKASLHFDVNRRGDKGIRRVFSENDVVRSVSDFSGGSFRCLPARIPEEEYVSEGGSDDGDGGISLSLRRSASFNGVWPECGIPLEELGLSGGGFGKGSKSGGGSGGDDYGFNSLSGGNSDRSKIGEYYQEMLKKNPSDSLLLRNYGQFLHEVKKDTEGAEEYYSRAILANPGDGELLSLYGKLIWDTRRDEDRAQSYFDRAVQASPDDCMVLGSYAHFMWKAEEDDDDAEEINKKTEMSSSRALGPAF